MDLAINMLRIRILDLQVLLSSLEQEERLLVATQQAQCIHFHVLVCHWDYEYRPHRPIYLCTICMARLTSYPFAQMHAVSRN